MQSPNILSRSLPRQNGRWSTAIRPHSSLNSTTGSAGDFHFGPASDCRLPWHVGLNALPRSCAALRQWTSILCRRAQPKIYRSCWRWWAFGIATFNTWRRMPCCPMRSGYPYCQVTCSNLKWNPPANQLTSTVTAPVITPARLFLAKQAPMVSTRSINCCIKVPTNLRPISC